MRRFETEQTEQLCLFFRITFRVFYFKSNHWVDIHNQITLKPRHGSNSVNFTDELKLDEAAVEISLLIPFNLSVSVFQCLSSLQFLERLDLSFNRLRRLPQDLTRSLSCLQELRLDHNLLQHVDSSSLGDSDNLRKLDLSHNRIRTVDVRAFSGLSRLRFLSLQGNRLNVLREGLLSRQQSLEDQD
uniref:Uncharacterized protein n=1 Tax=Kryptolebias marmoratus TaxID=37003 RepID=A0A3Q3A1Z8_KRYMA